MEFRRVIKDECGEVMIFCDDCRSGEVEKILEDHPEWYIGTVEV